MKTAGTYESIYYSEESICFVKLLLDNYLFY